MENIDIVIPWVTSDDKNWQKKASKYMDTNFDDNERYRDFDTLKFCLRSIAENAKWVHKVYLVTDKQVPTWLNDNENNIVVVDHTDFIPAQFLPTFNSNVILLNIHRIESLSEKFIVLNDDVFFNNPVQAKDFFVNDIPVDFYAESPIYPQGSFFKNLFNNMVLINKKFDKRSFYKKNFFKIFNIKNGTLNVRNLLSVPYSSFLGFYTTHTAQSYLKSSFVHTWKLYANDLDEQSHHKIRQETDITEWLVRYVQLVTGNFFPGNPKYGKYLEIHEINKLKETITSKVKVICLNDAGVKNIERTYSEIQKILINKFPRKTIYEK